MKRTTVRRAVALLFAGFGLSAAIVSSPPRMVSAEPVPLVKPGKPAVSIAAVREVAPLGVTARGAPELSPPALYDGTARSPLPIVPPSATDPATYSNPTVDRMPRRDGSFPIATSAFDPFADPGSGAQPNATQPNRGGIRGIWGGITKWTGDRAKSLTDAIAGPPQQPDPRVGQYPPPMPMGQPVAMNPGQPYPGFSGMPMPAYPGMMAGSAPAMNPGIPVPTPTPVPHAQPLQGLTSGGRMAYVGHPAFRWYGWGTTTPGANPYAPGGEYPASSAQWYSMSGATPGAFPVPVTNPFRPEPGPGAPVYAASLSSEKSGPSVPTSSFASTAVPAAPEGPQPIVESAPFRYTPPDELAKTSGSAPAVPPGPQGWRVRDSVPAPADAFPARPGKAEQSWQPISQAAPTKSPPAKTSTMYVGQSLPRPAAQTEILQVVATEPVDSQSILDRAAAVAGNGIRNLEVKKLGRENVVVRFQASSDVQAEAAAKAIAQIAELKSCTVTFDVVVER